MFKQRGDAILTILIFLSAFGVMIVGLEATKEPKQDKVEQVEKHGTSN